MKKVLIVVVCLVLVLTLVFTLGALGIKPDKPPGKPDKPGKPEHFIYELTFTGDVTGTEVSSVVEHCSVQGGFISSSNDEDFRPNLCLYLKDEFLVDKEFDFSDLCTVSPDGRYLDLSEHGGDITMQFFFIYPDTDKKLQLNVYGGYVLDDEKKWLSPSFTIIFYGDPAEILPTKGKRIPHWEGNVTITVVCAPQE